MPKFPLVLQNIVPFEITAQWVIFTFMGDLYYLQPWIKKKITRLLRNLVFRDGCVRLLVATKRLYKRVCPSVGPSVSTFFSRRLLSITAPSQPTRLMPGSVSGLV